MDIPLYYLSSYDEELHSTNISFLFQVSGIFFAYSSQNYFFPQLFVNLHLLHSLADGQGEAHEDG
jgi:hypothetical protein